MQSTPPNQYIFDFHEKHHNFLFQISKYIFTGLFLNRCHFVIYYVLLLLKMINEVFYFRFNADVLVFKPLMYE